VKNTFFVCEDDSEELCRRVNSAPPTQVARLRLGDRPAVRANGSMCAMAIDTDHVVEDMEGDFGSPAGANFCWPSTPEGDCLPYWLATPEGNFLPLYKIPREDPSKDVLSCVDSGVESTSTTSELPTAPSSPCGDESTPFGAFSSSELSRMESQALSSGTASSAPAQNGTASASSASLAANYASTGGSRVLARALAISQVQELIQSTENTTRFKFPPGVRVLQWSYRQKMSDRVFFRAVLSFLWNGVPSTVAGSWATCKKLARQSAAETALAVLQNASAPDANEEADMCVDLSHVLPSTRLLAEDPDTLLAPSAKDIQRLEGWLTQGSKMTSVIAWDCVSDNSQEGWCAKLQLNVMGISHTYVGPFLQSSADARAELARRVLWHMNHRGCRGMYIVDRRAWVATCCEVPPAPWVWSSGLGGTVDASK